MVWFSALAKVDGHLLAGSCKGEVYGKEEGSGVLQRRRACHKRPVTEICSFGKDRVLTASLDGSVKVWAGRCERQLGQMSLKAGVSAVCQVGFGGEGGLRFVVGDQMGGLRIVRWHESE